MTEKEKMLAGELYDCSDQELLDRWHKAKDLVRDYNCLDSENLEEKDRILTDYWAAEGKTCGLPLLFMWITERTSILATTAK